MAFVNIPGNPNWEYDNDPPDPGGALTALWQTGTNGIRINPRGEELYMNCRHKILHPTQDSIPNEISKTFWDGKIPDGVYYQPDGSSFYFQPDGSSFYLQP